MNKELEALEKMKRYVGHVMYRDKEIANDNLLNSFCDFDRDCCLIETALKDYEQLKIDFLKEATENDYLKTALENIKNHIVEIKEGNIIGKPVNNNELIIRFRKFDNTEECDLLKEVLL